MPTSHISSRRRLAALRQQLDGLNESTAAMGRSELLPVWWTRSLGHFTRSEGAEDTAEVLQHRASGLFVVMATIALWKHHLF